MKQAEMNQKYQEALVQAGLDKQYLNDNFPEFDRMSDDAAAPKQTNINDLAATVMAPGETFGDRLVAANLFIQCAYQTLHDCPAYPMEDAKLDQIVDTIAALRKALMQQLSRYPAASIQEGTKL